MRIAIIQGHPDPDKNHLGHLLAAAYIVGAQSAGHETRTIMVADLEFSIIRKPDIWQNGLPPESILESQEIIEWAEHILIIYPLWLGTMPALLKAFFEQLFRPGFAVVKAKSGKPWKQLLKGKSARVVITMGMPASIYRWFYQAHSLKSLERNILSFTGIGPVRSSLFGMVEAASKEKVEKWLLQMEALGNKAI